MGIGTNEKKLKRACFMALAVSGLIDGRALNFPSLARDEELHQLLSSAVARADVHFSTAETETTGKGSVQPSLVEKLNEFLLALAVRISFAKDVETRLEAAERKHDIGAMRLVCYEAEAVGVNAAWIAWVRQKTRRQEEINLAAAEASGDLVAIAQACDAALAVGVRSDWVQWVRKKANRWRAEDDLSAAERSKDAEAMCRACDQADGLGIDTKWISWVRQKSDWKRVPRFLLLLRARLPNGCAVRVVRFIV